jgi:uncharacterized membrane protein YgdD (TMEM256/DUF423 family)
MRKTITVFAGVSGLTSIGLGALDAHLLNDKMTDGFMSAQDLHAFETGVHYQLIHSVVLLVLVALGHKYTKGFKAAAVFFMIGIVLFSGSLYILSTTGFTKLDVEDWLGPVTPVGGLFLMLGWLWIIFSAYLNNMNKHEHSQLIE